MPKVSKVKRYQQQRLKEIKIAVAQRKRQPLQQRDGNIENQDLASESFQPRTCDVTQTTVTKLSQDEVPMDMVYKEKVAEPTNEFDSSHSQGLDAQEEEYTITTEPEQIIPEKHVGRRIVAISQFTKKLLGFCNHGPLGCSPSDIILTGEKQNGLMSTFTFKCKMCNITFIIENDNCEDNYLNLNACAVAGTIATGCGRSQLEEVLSAINLPSLTENTYDHNHKVIGKHWEKVAVMNMQEAGKREKELAVAQGKVTKEGYGEIDVIADGCWSKRSYKKNYSALSGAAAILGKNTGEILYLGIKNKYCQVCAAAQNTETDPKEHICFKNYNGPSTAMENCILVEGFKKSIEQHGLVYKRLISDGDSSTHCKILEARPYDDTTVEKLECRNHVMRNFCNKLQALTTETKYLLRHRKCVTRKVIMALRCTIIKAIKKHKENSDVELLFDDILRSHMHAFGEHTRCKTYFCTQVGTVNKEKVSTDFFTSSLWQRIDFLVQGVAAHSRSLIHDVDSNLVENFHSIVAKLVGGKRINFSKKNSYQVRLHAAAVAFNQKRSISLLYKSMNGGVSPSGKIKWLEEKRLKKTIYNRGIVKPKRRLFKQPSAQNKDYGEGCLKPDLDEETYKKCKEHFLSKLHKSDEEREKIQKNTILQSESGDWMELRRSLLTASNFGRIIKRRDDTSCANTVKDLLYKAANLCNVSSIKHGRENEKTALTQLETQLGIKIKRCGLFLDKELPFLGATPDGLCGDDTVIEVKCPITAHGIGIEEAIKKKKITFWKINKDGQCEINKNHNWFYQIQGQLRVTQRSKCIFAVWGSENEPLRFEIINKDDIFWQEKMERKLSKFYIDCILPELIDPRQPRNMPIRNPAYIEEEIKKKEVKKNAKQKKDD